MNIKRILCLGMLILGMQFAFSQAPQVKVKPNKPKVEKTDKSVDAEKAIAEKELARSQKQAEAERLKVEKAVSDEKARVEKELAKSQKQAEAERLKAEKAVSDEKARAEKELAKSQKQAEAERLKAEAEIAKAEKAVQIESDKIAVDSIKLARKLDKEIKKDSMSSLHYRKLLGLQFNKNVDYKSSINYFEDKDNYALLEKGVSFMSFNFGLASFKMDNKWIEPIVKIDDTYYTQFAFKLSGGYFIANNTAIALKVSYGFHDNRIKLNSDILQLLINAKSYETNNVGTDVNVAAVVRNYVPIGIQQRFFIVTETALGYKYSESYQRNIYDNGARLSKVESKSHMGMLGISPGVSYFMTKGFAFEFMLSPIQIYYQNSQSINDEVNQGATHSYGLTFAFTPLNIQLGFSYYFGINYKKNHEYMSKYYSNGGK